MFHRSSNGNIELTRGDTGEFSVVGRYNRKPLTFQAGDIIQFHLLEPNKPFEYPILSAEFTLTKEAKDFLIRIEHSDTVGLPPYHYYYEIKLIRKMEDEEEPFVMTIVPRKKFIVE